MAELEQQEIEGVKFTPTRSIDMDKAYAADDAGAGEGGEGGDKVIEGSEKVIGDNPQGDSQKDNPAGNTAGQPAGGGAKPGDSSPGDSDDVDLDEILVSIGDQERKVSDIVKDYQALSQKSANIDKDEFLKNFVEHYLAGGDPADYLKSKQDLTKVDDLTLMKNRFWESNSDLDEDVREALFEKELSEKYGMNPDGTFDDETSKTAKIGKQLMKRDAEKVRTEKSESQKKFEIKRREAQKQEQPVKVNPADQLKAISELPEVKDLLAKKSVVLEDGVSLPVENPDEVIGMMADLNKFWAKFKDPKGNVNWNQVKRLMAFASDPAKYDKHLLSIGNDRGQENYLKEQKNIGGLDSKTIDKSLDTEGLNLGSDADKEAFLKAAIIQKNKGRR